MLFLYAQIHKRIEVDLEGSTVQNASSDFGEEPGIRGEFLKDLSCILSVFLNCLNVIYIIICI